MSGSPGGQSPIPPDVIPITFEGFNGINTNASRPGIEDDQGYWFDGFMPVGKNYLRTLYGISSPVFTPPPVGTSVIWFDFANLGATPIMVVLLSDGSLWQVNTVTLIATEMALAGTILSPSFTNIAITQWGSQLILIIVNQTNGYFYWDGTTFYAPGATGPDGKTVPTGIMGNGIEIYQGRVWVVNGAILTFSAPGSYSDFTTGDGGGTTTSTDSFLRVGYTVPKSTNGFLYLIADSSINYISGVQTSGTMPVTTFTNQNADPEIGSPWASTVDVFSRNIVFANPFGAHISYGGAVTKISDALDGVYNTVPNFSSFTPSAAKAIIFGKKVWMLLLPIIDPVTGQQVNKLLMWNGKIWWASQQDVGLQYIQHQEINSVITAFGTDGSKIYKLFNQPSAGFTKTAQSKLWSQPYGYEVLKTAYRLWGMTYYYSLLSPSLSISIDNETGTSPTTINAGPTKMNWTTADGTEMVWETAGGVEMTWTDAGGGVVIFNEACGQTGILLGFTLTTSAADMSIVSLKMGTNMVGFTG